MFREKIEEATRSSTSQCPISEKKLLALAKTAADKKQLAAVLSLMVSEYKLSACTITKKGVTDTVYWPTGLGSRFTASYSELQNLHRRHPRRDEAASKDARSR